IGAGVRPARVESRRSLSKGSIYGHASDSASGQAGGGGFTHGARQPQDADFAVAGQDSGRGVRFEEGTGDHIAAGTGSGFGTAVRVAHSGSDTGGEQLENADSGCAILLSAEGSRA